MPPTVTPVEAELIGVEARDSRPSEITVSFIIARANPEVEVENITWTHNVVNGSRRDLAAMLAMSDSKYNFSADFRTLTVFNLSFFDAGSIMLTASNEAGTSNATLQLIIHGLT